MPSDHLSITHRARQVAAFAANLALSVLFIAAAGMFLNEVAIPMACGVFVTYIFMKTAAEVMSLPLVRTFAIFVVFVFGTGLSYWLLSIGLGAVPSLTSLVHHAWAMLAAKLGAGAAVVK